MMPESKGHHISYSIYILLYAIAVPGVIKWNWMAEAMLACYLCFIPMAIYIFHKTKMTSSPSNNLLYLYIKVWGMQILSILWLWVFIMDWHALYGLPATPNANCYQIASTILITVVMVIMVMMLNKARRMTGRNLSLLLFFPDKKSHDGLIVRGHFWMRKGSLWALLLLWNLSLLVVLKSWSKLSLFIHPVALLLAIVMMLAVSRSVWFYDLLQQLLKKYKWNFLSVLVSLMFATSLLGMTLTWLLKPLLNGLTISLAWIHMVNPDLVIITTGLMLTPFFVMALAKMTLADSPRSIFMAALLNPLLWLMVSFWIRGGEVDYWYFLPSSAVIAINMAVLAITSILLAKNWFAWLMVSYFGNTPDQHCGPMPRLLMKPNLTLQFELMLIFVLQAPFLLSINLLAMAGGLFIVYVWCFFYFTKLEKSEF